MGEITPEQQRNRERLYDISTQLQRGGISPTRSLFMAMKVMDTQLESRIEREKLSESNRTGAAIPCERVNA